MHGEETDGMEKAELRERGYRGGAIASGLMGGGAANRAHITKGPEGPVPTIQAGLEKECAVLLEAVKLLESRLHPVLADVPQPEDPQAPPTNSSSPMGQYLGQITLAVNLAHTRVRQVIERLEV